MTCKRKNLYLCLHTYIYARECVSCSSVQLLLYYSNAVYASLTRDTSSPLSSLSSQSLRQEGALEQAITIIATNEQRAKHNTHTLYHIHFDVNYTRDLSASTSAYEFGFVRAERNVQRVAASSSPQQPANSGNVTVPQSRTMLHHGFCPQDVLSGVCARARRRDVVGAEFDGFIANAFGL